MSKYKNTNLIWKEKQAQDRIQADAVLKQHAKGRKRKIDTLIEEAYQYIRDQKNNKYNKDNFIMWVFTKSHPTYRAVKPDEHKNLYRLLKVVKRCKGFFDKNPHNKYLTALKELAYWGDSWIREPEDWKTNFHNVDRQLSSLARHLLAKYKVPTFMDEAWTEGNFIPQKWFVHIGKGLNIRKASEFPIVYTKKMAHHFVNVPKDLTVDKAVRFAQIIGFKGSKNLAHALVNSKVGYNINNGKVYSSLQEDFITTVIHFFINNDHMLDYKQIGHILDYVWDRKYYRDYGWVGGNRVQLDAAQPNFTMKGRTIEDLIDQADNWQKELHKVQRNHYKKWDSCGIAGFERLEGKKDNQRFWSIKELCDSSSLRNEGQKMNHCVYSYSYSCGTGQCAIYSLTRERNSSINERLTIEVHPRTREITQMSMRYNKPPNKQVMRIVHLWAAKEKLTVRKYSW
jgi:hypothetical protein